MTLHPFVDLVQLDQQVVLALDLRYSLQQDGDPIHVRNEGLLVLQVLCLVLLVLELVHVL